MIEYNQAEIETDEENEDFAQTILKKPRRDKESNYLSCKFVLPTSNLLERFFALPDLHEMRQSISPCHREEQLYLKVNNKFWNETLVNTIVNSKNKLEVHRTGNFPSGRTGLIEAGYRPNRTLSPIVSDEGLFSELSNEDYKKRSRFLPQSGEKLFSFRHNLMNFDLHSQIQFFDAHTLFIS